MTAGRGDPALETQPAFGVVKQSLPRGPGTEKTSCPPLIIHVNFDARNGGGGMPEIRFNPIGIEPLGLNEPNVSRDPAAASSHQTLHLPQSGA
ncbi:hypothetical protein HNQ65_001744 [Prosthecobacter vanneervenii]|uniref:Uncharacterized protein n=1 Tax=Prosthecobacter vanneervenii TaxID=48466 RepID=A0A7W7Y9L1_9BACT|nr:hypothetical protein [Prosthecobacter vanneervenii]